MLKPGSNLQKAVVAGFSMSGSLLAFGIFGYLVSKKYDNQLLSSLYKSKTNGISIKVTDDDLYFYGIPANNEINFINTELINRGILTNSN